MDCGKRSGREDGRGVASTWMRHGTTADVPGMAAFVVDYPNVARIICGHVHR